MKRFARSCASARVGQPAVPENTGRPSPAVHPGGGHSLPDSVAAFMGQAEEMASALFQLAPDRAVTEDEVKRVADFVSDLVLDQALEAIKTPFAAAMVALSAEHFKDELASRLAAKIGLRDMRPAGVA